MATRIYCELCSKQQPMRIDYMSKDDLNTDIWGDLLCSVCDYVIATISVDEAGVYGFVKVEVEIK